MLLFLFSIDSENKKQCLSFTFIFFSLQMHKIQVHQSRPQTLNKQEILRTSTSFDCCNASFCIEPRPTFLSTYWQLQTKHFPWKDLFHTSHELHWKLRGMEREMGCRYIRIIIQDHQAYKSFAKTWVKWDVRPFAKIPTCFQALHSAFSARHVAHQPAAQRHGAQFLLRSIRRITPQLGNLFVVPTHWILLNLPPICWKFF